MKKFSIAWRLIIIEGWEIMLWSSINNYADVKHKEHLAPTQCWVYLIENHHAFYFVFLTCGVLFFVCFLNSWYVLCFLVISWPYCMKTFISLQECFVLALEHSDVYFNICFCFRVWIIFLVIYPCSAFPQPFEGLRLLHCTL